MVLTQGDTLEYQKILGGSGSNASVFKQLIDYNKRCIDSLSGIMMTNHNALAESMQYLEDQGALPHKHSSTVDIMGSELPTQENQE